MRLSRVVWLQEVPFVAGEIFSVADITALMTVDFATNGIATPIPAESRALKVGRT